MKKKFFLILLTGIWVLLNTCIKDEDSKKDEDNEIPFEEAIQHEALSEEEVAFWDNLESIELSAEEILLPNGLTLNEFSLVMDSEPYKDGYKKNTVAINENPVNLKNKLIKDMCLAALQLTDRKKFIYDEAEMAPAQFGLAYSFGQRIHTKRELPPKGSCPNKLYGLDCSGLIHQLFKYAGITRGLWGTANSLRNPDTLIKAIKYKYPDFDELKVEDLGNIPVSKFQTGDIIYWLKPDEETGKLKAKHIGMLVLDTLRNLAIVQSNGVSKEWKPGDCVKNYSIERGPRIVSLENAVEPGVFGDSYGITRISVDIKPPDYNRCGAMVKVYGYYHESTPTTSRDYESDNGSIQTYDKYTGSFNENVFYGSFDKTVVSVKYSGQLTAFFNANYDAVEWFGWYEDVTGSNFTKAKSFIVTNIKESLENNIFKEEGETSCAHISGLKHVQTSPTGLNYNLRNHKCTWGSTVYIRFSKE